MSPEILFLCAYLIFSCVEASLLEYDGEKEVFRDRNSTLANFDLNQDRRLDLPEFANLCRALFQNEFQEPYTIPLVSMPTDNINESLSLDAVFQIFDVNQDGFIEPEEFSTCFSQWIAKILNPVSALVIIKMQNDFVHPDGAMSGLLEDGTVKAIEAINKILDFHASFSVVIYVLDLLPENHSMFLENIANQKVHASSGIFDTSELKPLDNVTFEDPENGNALSEQILFPKHAVQNTWGSRLHPGLKFQRDSKTKKIFKGMNPDVQHFSAFQGSPQLQRYLDDFGVTDVFICGIPTDFCVGSTALESLDLGYRTILIEDASKGFTPEGTENVKLKIREGGGVIVHSDSVANMVKGLDRRPELGLFLAEEIEKKI